MRHVETVQKIYQAFGRADVPGILAELAEDVEWEYGVNSTDVPWLQPGKGRPHAAAFFALLSGFEFHAFTPTHFLEKGDLVVVLIALDATVRSTGRRVVEEDEVHLWHFDAGGKVKKFRHRADTHQHWLAFHG